MWITWEKLDSLIYDNDFVIFGQGVWADQLMAKTHKSPLFIVDNNKLYTTSEFNLNKKVKVFDVSALSKIKKGTVILICTTSYEVVAEQLKSLGFSVGIDCFISPSLYDFKLANKLKTLQRQFLIACSDLEVKDSDTTGGGLYKYNLGSKEYLKVFSGRIMDIQRIDNKYLISEESSGIFELDRDFNLVNSYLTPQNTKIHGLAYNSDEELLYVANTTLDKVMILDLNKGHYVDEIVISSPLSNDEYCRHHITDLFYNNGKLHIAMYSLSGFWKDGIYDGGVKIFDTKLKQCLANVFNDLWLPHSVKMVDGRLVVCDSRRGQVYHGTNNVVSSISGFVRGVTFDRDFYYLGQSEQFYFDTLNKDDYCYINCGIHILDKNSKLKRFESLDGLSNIQSIVICND